MAKILVSGLINIETSVRVDKFPIEYSPVRYPFFGVNSTISGVGFNVAKALAKLGDQAILMSMIGADMYTEQIYKALTDAKIEHQHVLDNLVQTPQSVILFDHEGRRQINVDLKDVQSQSYPLDQFESALPGCELAAMCNINYSREFLQAVKSANIPLATDIHSISRLDDEYEQDFLAAADILFCSDEMLPCSPEEWAQKVFNRYGVNILVVGLGRQGAFLAVRDVKLSSRYPAIHTRPVVNTIGAGDALFSCFTHYYLRTKDPSLALQKAIVFASYKIGESGAANGFLGEDDLELLYRQSSVQ